MSFQLRSPRAVRLILRVQRWPHVALAPFEALDLPTGRVLCILANVRTTKPRQCLRSALHVPIPAHLHCGSDSPLSLVPGCHAYIQANTGPTQATLAKCNEAVFGQLVAFARERHQESGPARQTARTVRLGTQCSLNLDIGSGLKLWAVWAGVLIFPAIRPLEPCIQNRRESKQAALPEQERRTYSQACSCLTSPPLW